MKRTSRIAAVVAAISALAIPATASAYNYVYNGGMYPGGGTQYTGYSGYNYNSMSVPPGGEKYHLQFRYVGDVHAADNDYSTQTNFGFGKTYSDAAYVGCYRVSTAAGGGTGYRSPINCTGS